MFTSLIVPSVAVAKKAMLFAWKIAVRIILRSRKMKKYIEWGTGGFTRDDWKFLRELIRKENIRSVLEYGCGLSTELMLAEGLEVVALETQQDYLLDIPDSPVRLCTYLAYPDPGHRFDLAFIDGPGAYEFERTGLIPERQGAAIHALRYADLILLHDGGLGQPEIILDAGFRQDPPGFNGIGARMVLFRR